MKRGLLKASVVTALLALAAGTVTAQTAQVGAGDGPVSNTGSNPYSPANGHPYRHGVIPTIDVLQRMKAWQAGRPVTNAATGIETLSYGGGVNGVGVLSGQSKVYLVFYGTQWGTQSTDANGNLTFSGDANGAAAKAQMMFKGIGTGSELWSADLTQWCDGAGVSSGAVACPASGANYVPYQQNIFAGAWYDNSAASPAAATPTQLGQEAVKAATHFGNTTTASNRYTYYIILSPHGTNPDNYQGQYCAWHDWTGDAGITSIDLAFSNQPYNIDSGAGCGVGFVNSPGTLDGWTMTLGHEWHEMMSDQFPAGGWTNHTGNATYNGQENSDECAWIAAGSTGGAANVVMANGTYTEQASWSNDTNACAISHPIVSHGGGGGGQPTANFSFVTNGLTVNFTDSSTDSGGTITSHAWTFGDGATSTATSPSHSYAAAGTYSVKETVTDSASGLSSSKTSSVTVSIVTNVLQNGVGITISDATVNHQQNWTMVVPAGATNLVFSMSGGTGDPDLYVKFGSAPTTSSYDCRPYVSGPAESCPIATAQAGTYYVMVNTYAAYSGTTLKGSYTAPGSGGTPTANFTFTTSGLTATFTDTSTDSGGTLSAHSWTFGDGGTSTATNPSHTYAAAGNYSVSETVTDSVNGSTNTKTSSVTVSIGSCGGTVLCSGVPVTGLAATTGNYSATYTMVVPAGQTKVTFTISGSTGDADLYVKIGSAPTTSSYSCRPYLTGDNETCTFNSPAAGTYYVKVRAYATYSGVTLTGTIQ